MITRIGDFAQNQRITTSLIDAQSRARELQAQLSSGRIADRFQDIARDAGRLFRAKTDLQASSAYIRNNRLIVDRLQVMESSIGSIFDLATRTRNLLIQRLNDGSAQPGVVAAEAALMLEQVVSQLNVEHGGRYLLAGSKTDTPPVELDPAFAAFGGPDDTFYRGDAVELTVRADDGLSFTYGMTADRAGFMKWSARYAQ